MLVVTLGGIFIVSTLIGVLNTGLEAQARRAAQGPLARDRARAHGHPRLVAADLHDHLRDRRGQREPARRVRSSSSPTATRSRWRTRSARGSARPARRSSSAARAARSTSTTCGIASPRPRARSSSSRPRATTPTPTSSRRSSRSPTTRTAAPSRTTSSPRSATARTSRSRGWSGRDEVELILVRASSSRGSPPRPAASPACRSSTPSCSTSAATRSTSTEQPALVGQHVRRRAARLRRRVGHRPARRTAGRRTSTRRWTRVIGPGDRLIVIAEDDDHDQLSAARRPTSTRRGCARRRPGRRRRSGRWSSAGTAGRRRSSRELDAYVADGLGDHWSWRPAPDRGRRRCACEPRLDDAAARRSSPATRPTARRSTRLGVETFDHVIVLCYDTLDPQRADARTLVTLLHLRDIAAQARSATSRSSARCSTCATARSPRSPAPTTSSSATGSSA